MEGYQGGSEWGANGSADPGLWRPGRGLLLLAGGAEDTVNNALDRIRRFVAHSLGGWDQEVQSLQRVVDWQMFEYDSDEDRLEVLHHPFTAPQVGPCRCFGEPQPALAEAEAEAPSAHPGRRAAPRPCQTKYLFR